MKEEILKRAMFAMPLSKEARNSGIMAGFDMDEMEDELDQDENAEMEDMPAMSRTPQNPEILMNNLRGDVRSVDARYMELAQMVGEEAAMDTPPEVLAMLQPQLAAQQGGIGALPQAQGMMPPGAGQPMPPQMGGAPQPGPAMPQGGIPMPQGMESAPPFSQGAEAPQGYAHGGAVEPPTPDGMPPMHAFAGAFVNPAMRAAQFLGDKAATYGSAANAALGRAFMQPSMTQPYLENLRGPGGKFLAQQVQKGGDLIYPTFTQGITQGAARLADQYPKLAATVGPALGVLGLASAPRGGAPAGSSALAEQIPTDTRESLIEQGQKPSVLSLSTEGPFTTTAPDRYTITEGTPRPPAATTPAPAAPAPAAEEAPKDELGDFITEKLAAFDQRQGAKGVADSLKAAKELTKAERIKAGMEEYAPMFKELLGEDKESAKMNALLLLSEAGLKLASIRKPTLGMAIGEAFANVPKGFAAIAAQERELGTKIKMASLQQAISDVDAQDKYAQALKLQMLKGDYDLLKEQAKKGGTVTEDGGMGLRLVKTKDGGSYVGNGIDPEDPTVKSAVGSRFTLRDTDNPFVENRGAAPTTLVTDKTQRLELGKTLTSLDNSLKTLEGLKGIYASAYGPGAWFSDKVNNLFVPVDPTGIIKPNMDFADAYTRVKTGMNSIMKTMASANDSGRVAVQEQEWARQTAQGLDKPDAFFKDKEVAAQGFAATEAMLRNARQQVLTQLGYEGNDYVMRTPNTGTKNDPFVIPSDPQAQKTMFTFLGSTIGKLQDPKAIVYLRMPNGKVDAFNPTQLRGLIQ